MKISHMQAVLMLAMLGITIPSPEEIERRRVLDAKQFRRKAWTFSRTYELRRPW